MSQYFLYYQLAGVMLHQVHGTNMNSGSGFKGKLSSMKYMTESLQLAAVVLQLDCFSIPAAKFPEEGLNLSLTLYYLKRNQSIWPSIAIHWLFTYLYLFWIIPHFYILAVMPKVAVEKQCGSGYLN